jgi:hypothetical protein
MNPFSPGDRVLCKEKSRRNGTVLYKMCGVCEKCRTMPKAYEQCTATEEEKKKLLVSYADSNKRYKYEYTELELEAPLPVKPPQKICDLSAKDIRPLGDATLSVPLIVCDDEEEEEQHEEPNEENQADNETRSKPLNGIFMDQFLSLQQMERPI